MKSEEAFEKFIKARYLYVDEIDFSLELDGGDYRSDGLKEWFWIWQAAIEWKEKELLSDNKNTYTLQLHDD